MKQHEAASVSAINDYKTAVNVSVLVEFRGSLAPIEETMLEAQAPRRDIKIRMQSTFIDGCATYVMYSTSRINLGSHTPLGRRPVDLFLPGANRNISLVSVNMRFCFLLELRRLKYCLFLLV